MCFHAAAVVEQGGLGGGPVNVVKKREALAPGGPSGHGLIVAAVKIEKVTP